MNNLNVTVRPLPVQVLCELWYAFLFLFVHHIAGIFYKLPFNGKGNKRPVVLISGFWGRTISWGRLYKELIKNGHPVYAVPMGFQVGNIKKKGEELEKFLSDNNIEDCYLVCHSMGGLICWNNIEQYDGRIRMMITLGTPLYGSRLAYYLPLSVSIRQMQPDSELIKSLKKKYKTFSRAISISAGFDQMVVPAKNSRLNQKNDIVIPEAGHLNLYMGPTGIKYIITLLKRFEEKN